MLSASYALLSLLAVACLFGLASGVVVDSEKGNSTKMKCESLDYLKCGENHPEKAPCVPTILDCESPEPGKRAHCFALLNSTMILKKGCWLDSKECYDRHECVTTPRGANGDLKFCCCEGDLCNVRVKPGPSIDADQPQDSAHNYPSGVQSSYVENEEFEDETMKLTWMAYVGLPIVGFLVVASVAFYYYRKKSTAHQYFDQMPVETALPLFTSSLGPQIQAAIASNGPYRGGPLFDPLDGENCQDPNAQSQNALNTTHFLELKARGRFGAVWRAQCGDRIVAVKTFSIQEKESWESELEIYSLPAMNHPNILEFLAAEIRGEGLQREFWILSAYHSYGSLNDYLKNHTVSLEELIKMARGLTAGLSHLHDDIHPGDGGNMSATRSKPRIAHRDFKSKNVLVKDDLTCCIADFGLALVFTTDRNVGDVHGQVGTKRYMAPEVLEGAINFNRDCFLRIDMYACGLVMWEVLSRCTECYDKEPPEYRQPFEDEVGPHPTLEEMQEIVVGRRMRPPIPPGAWCHQALAMYCTAMEECWDADIDARLSAACVHERVNDVARQAGFGADIPRGEAATDAVRALGNKVGSAAANNGAPHPPGHLDPIPTSNLMSAMMMMRRSMVGGGGASTSGDSTLTASLLLSSAENSVSNSTSVMGGGGGGAVGAPPVVVVRPGLPGSSGPPPYAYRDAP